MGVKYYKIPFTTYRIIYGWTNVDLHSYLKVLGIVNFNGHSIFRILLKYKFIMR